MCDLVVEGLSVRVGGRMVLKGVDLSIGEGETHVLFGPNGCGKSSLLLSLLGVPKYEVVSGRVLLDGVDVTGFSVDERVREGVGLAFQVPPEVPGVSLSDMLKICSGVSVDSDLGRGVLGLVSGLNFSKSFLERSVNVGFSGGERKRSEILQLMVLEPGLVLIDEPDSGVDVENLRVIGELLEGFLEDRSALIVTHLGHILDYVSADRGHVMIGGELGCSGDASHILSEILRGGYEMCVECVREQRSGLPSRGERES